MQKLYLSLPERIFFFIILHGIVWVKSEAWHCNHLPAIVHLYFVSLFFLLFSIFVQAPELNIVSNCSLCIDSDGASGRASCESIGEFHWWELSLCVVIRTRRTMWVTHAQSSMLKLLLWLCFLVKFSHMERRK